MTAIQKGLTRACVALFAAALLTACDSTPVNSAASASLSNSWPHGGMVSAANPYAAQAAADVLRQGGHAVDAAIAAHTVLGLVEPQSSGIGGGAFMLVFDASTGAVSVYDGRERAPAGIDANLFKAKDGNTIGFRDAWQGGVSTGVPGSVALYKLAHDAHGILPWSAAFQPAIKLATQGFEVSPRLANFLPRIAQFGRLDEHPAAAAYFYPNGTALTAGSTRTNPDYANTLEQIASDGPDAFYTGEIAAAIVAATAAPPLPGRLGLDDLANYKATRSDAVCLTTGGNRLCTAPPPSSGVAAISMLALYDLLVPEQADEQARVRALVDAQRLAYADRDHYIGDPEFANIPGADLIDPAYLAARAKQRIAPSAEPTPGDPGAVLRNQPLQSRFAEDRPTEVASTTHLSIIDQAGNAVSLTASVEAPFGNSRFVRGFLLNNQLTDFRRDADGKVHANSPAAGKRPRSSMSPVIAFDDAGNLQLVTGSPGGNSILAYVAKALVASLRWDMTDEEAVAWPNIVARGPRVRVETAAPAGKALATRLSEAGYDVQEREGENSGLHQLRVGPAGLTGAADPRREGKVIALPPRQ